MWKTRSIAATIASLAIGGVATGLAAAHAETYDGYAPRDDAKERLREVRLMLPRTATGAVDAEKLAAEIRAALAAGARDIRIRDTALSAADLRALRRVVARFDFERVRIREDDNRVRVELRNEDRDEIRRRIEVRRDDDRDDFRKRIEIRDRDDNRVRNEVRVERRENDGRRPERVEVARVERPEKAERVEKAERPEKVERAEKAERPEHHDRVERPDRSGRH